MRFKNFNLSIGKSKEKPGKNSDEALVDQITGLEEQVNVKTRELEKVEQQLKKLSSSGQTSPDEASPPHPHGPLVELTVEPPEVKSEEEKESGGSVLEEATEELRVIKVKAEAAEPAQAAKPAAEPAPAPEAKKDDDDSLLSLFSDEDENVNPLAALICALPEVSSQELVDDLEEIKQIIKENTRGRLK